MSVVHVNSISGITSITTPSSSDVLTLHTSNNVERLRITSDGKVGINTTTPGRQLEVFDATQGTIAIKSGDAGQSSLWLSDSDINIGGIYYEHGNDALGIRVNDNERLRINSSGDVQVNGGDVHIDANGELAVFESDTNLAFTNSGKLAFDYSGNIARIRSTHNGSGTTRNLGLYIANTTQILLTSTQTKVNKEIIVGLQGGNDVTKIGGGSGIGAYIQLDHASSGINTKLMGNNDSYLNQFHGNLAIGEDDPDGNKLLIRAASTVGTKNGHIMLSGDGATNGEGPQIVFSESGSGSSYAGAYIGHIREGSNSTGSLVFGTRNVSGDVNTVPVERLRIWSSGQATFDKGAPSSSNQVIARFQCESSRKLDIVWHDSGSLMGFDTPGNHSYIFKINGSEKLRITSSALTYKGSTDGVLNLDTDDSRGSFIRFQKDAGTKCWVGSAQGMSMGDLNDLGLMAVDKIRFNSVGSEKLIIDGNEVRHGHSNVLGGSLDSIRINNGAAYRGTVLRGTGGSGGMANYDEYCFLFNRMGSDGNIITFNAQGSQEGAISVSGSSVSYNGGVLTRWSQLVGISTNVKSDRPTIYQGTVMSNLDEMCEWTDEENMQLNKTQVSTASGDKNVAGVFWAWDDDDDVYTNDFYVAQTGDFIVRVGAATTITRGDLLESAGDGTAKPQSDDIVRSKTVGKITSGIAHTTYADGSKAYPCVLMAS